MSELTDAREWLRGMGCVWAFQAPLCLLTVALLASGRVALSKAEITRAVTLTFALNCLIVFPAVWAIVAAGAAAESVAHTSRVLHAVQSALVVFPACWSLVAYVVLGLAVRAAKKRGAALKPLAVRLASSLLLSGVVVVAATIVSFAIEAAFFGPMVRD